MKPVLIVDRIRKNVVSLFYHDGEVSSVTTLEENGMTNTYYDIRQALYVTDVLKVNMKEALVWENRFTPLVEKIQKRIEVHEEVMDELAREHIKSKNENARESYLKLEQHVDGLTEAIGLASEHNNSEWKLHVEKKNLNSNGECL